MITREDVQFLFASALEKFEDAALRDKVIDCWVEACRRGSWETMAQLRQMPFTLLTDTRGVSFVEHTLAVTEGAYGLARAQMAAYESLPYPIDLDRLLAGGLLHDIGKLIETEPDGAGGYRKSRKGLCARHPISGAILASELGFSDEIVNTIACHAKEGEGRPQVVETVLIHQADFGTFNPLVMMAGGKLII
jgi:putative nucleotidyltransferase with HDIG domain